MSSMRNAVARRPHRERAQPLERRRLGLLEKHKVRSRRAPTINHQLLTITGLLPPSKGLQQEEEAAQEPSRKGVRAKRG
jgi:U3 small nucleolar RNA-associated protein 11